IFFCVSADVCKVISAGKQRTDHLLAGTAGSRKREHGIYMEEKTALTARKADHTAPSGTRAE
ncbi:MAG: hypothetical protein PHG11_07190, partial [Eubacteriales bacterium]|nr:hypothetical protein [Eubacteriales bacterium]